MRHGEPKRVLVTGAGGFLGRHLCPLLAEEFDVIGVDLAGVAPSFEGRWREAPSSGDSAGLLDELQPDSVVHAAFRNRKPAAWSRTDYLARVLDENVRLFEACAERNIEVVLCSSSAVYGAAPGNRALVETDPVQPVSLYGVAKALQEMLPEVFAHEQLRVCTVRLFNLIGPGQRPGMLVPDWLEGVAAIDAGGESVLRVRNLRTARDFVDVRDAARALRAMIADFRSGTVVNVAGGESVSLMELSRLLQTLTAAPFEIVENDPDVAPTDVAAQRGDTSRARELWGWTPTIDWRQSVTDAWHALRAATATGSRHESRRRG
jgi:GDP-4-dehydro-6-deoxy-D-mannose reductase